MAATRDKAALRARLAAAAVAQPDYRVVAPGQSVAAAASQVGYPCVVKPVSRSGSQGVIRADDDVQAVAAVDRVRAIVGPRSRSWSRASSPGPKSPSRASWWPGRSRC